MSSYRSKTSHSAFPVLCIPRVYDNITEERIRRVFNDLNMGTLSHIDIVPKVNAYGEKFNRVFVHYREWNNTPNSVGAQVRLLEGKEIKIIYDDPWFWKISAYREATPHPHSREKVAHRPKATIQFEDEDDDRSRLPIAPRLPSPLPRQHRSRQPSPPRGQQRQSRQHYRSRQQSPPRGQQHKSPPRPRSPNYPPPFAACATAGTTCSAKEEEECKAASAEEDEIYYEEGECDEEFDAMYGDLDDDEVEEAAVVLPPVTVNYGTNLVVPNRKPKPRAR